MLEKDFLFKRVPTLSYVSAFDDGLVVDWDKEAEGAEAVPALLEYYKATGYKVPDSVPMTRFLIACAKAGFSKAHIQAMIAALPEEQALVAEVFYERETKVERYHPVLQLFKQAASLTDEEVDAIFIACEEIEI